jgi:hypothetical protein
MLTLVQHDEINALLLECFASQKGCMVSTEHYLASRTVSFQLSRKSQGWLIHGRKDGR